MASGRSITGILGLDHTTEAAALATAKSGRSAIFIDSTSKKAKIVGEGGLVGELGGGLATATLDNTDDGTTVARGNHYICDTSTAAFGLTLPDGDEGAVIRFSDAAETFGTNALTLTPATGEAIDGGAANETFVLDLDGGWVQLMWDGSKWVIDASLLAGVSDGSFPGGLTADTVDELTAGAGVTIDGVLLKDGGANLTGGLSADTVDELTSGAGVTVDGVLLKDGGANLTGGLTADTVDELTAGAGVTVDGVLLKDNGIVGRSDTPSAGQVGEILLSSSTTSFTTGTYTDGSVSLSLGQGVWIVQSIVLFSASSAGVMTRVIAGVSDFSGGTYTDAANSNRTIYTIATGYAGTSYNITSPFVTRVVGVGGLTVYPKGFVDFASGTVSGATYLRAIRIA